MGNFSPSYKCVKCVNRIELNWNILANFESPCNVEVDGAVVHNVAASLKVFPHMDLVAAAVLERCNILIFLHITTCRGMAIIWSSQY